MEKIIKNGIRFSIIALIGILIYVLFSSGGDSEDSADDIKKRESANELSILFGGGPAGSSSADDKSIFESDFYKSGNISYEEKGEVQEEEKEGENPINPQTGKPYDEDAMKQFDSLRSKFPDNDLIPRKLNEEEKAAKKQRDEQIATAARNVFANAAAPEDVKLHFDYKLKQAKDRMDIIDYLINQKGMAAEDSEEAEKVKQIFSTIKSQYDSAADERQKAFEKSGIEVYSLDSIGKR